MNGLIQAMFLEVSLAGMGAVDTDEKLGVAGLACQYHCTSTG